MDIGLKELEDILDKDLSRQMSKIRPLNPNKRSGGQKLNFYFHFSLMLKSIW